MNNASFAFFAPNPWFVGTVLFLILTGIGAASGLLARRQRYLGALTVVHAVVLLYCFALVVMAIVDLLYVGPLEVQFGGRGGGMWLALGSAGLASGAITLALGPRLWRARRAAEERRMFAQDL